MSEAAKAQKQGVKIFPHPDAGKTRDKVAAAVGLGSGRTYETAKKVWEAAKNGEEAARERTDLTSAKRLAEVERVPQRSTQKIAEAEPSFGEGECPMWYIPRTTILLVFFCQS